MTDFEPLRTRTMPRFSEDDRYPDLVRAVEWIEAERPASFGFRDLAERMSGMDDEERMSRAVWVAAILAGSGSAVLDIELMMADGEERLAVRVERDEEGEFVVHPGDGRIVRDFASRTYPTFRLRDGTAPKP